jgi:hypothetical protein
VGFSAILTEVCGGLDNEETVSKDVSSLLPNQHQSRVLSEIPFLEAIIVTAPTVRFNDLDIFATPTFCFASPFKARKSVAVHGRIVRAFFAIVSPSV